MSRLGTTLKAWPAVFLATVALSFVTQQAAKLFGVDLPDQAQVEFVKRYAGWNLNFLFIVAQVVVVVPALEEILFRWLMWRVPLGAARAWKGAWRVPTALAVAGSALFSFAHYVDYVSLAKTGAFVLTGWNSAFLALFLFGLAQCRLYRRTDRLWCPMLNHALFNLTNLALIFVLPV